MKKLSILTGLFDFDFIDSVYLTKILIGFKIYLFKKTEKMKMTKATANTVLIIKFFLSSTATSISLDSSLTRI